MTLYLVLERVLDVEERTSFPFLFPSNTNLAVANNRADISGVRLPPFLLLFPPSKLLLTTVSANDAALVGGGVYSLSVCGGRDCGRTTV